MPPRSMQRSLTFARRSSATAHPGSNARAPVSVVHQRLGYMRENDGDIEYLIQRESWKSLMAGRDARRIARELAARGILKRDSEGRPDPKERVPGHKNSQRVYVVRHSALFADGGEDA